MTTGEKKRRIWEGRDYSCIVMRMAKVEREEKYAERIGMQWGSVGHRYNSNTGACVSRFGGKLLFNSAAFVIVVVVVVVVVVLDLDFDTNDLIVMALASPVALFLLLVASELRAWTWMLLKRSTSFRPRIFLLVFSVNTRCCWEKELNFGMPISYGC